MVSSWLCTSELANEFVRRSRPSRRTRRLCPALPVEFYYRIVARPRSLLIDWVYHGSSSILRFPTNSSTWIEEYRNTASEVEGRRQFLFLASNDECEHRTRGNDSLFSVVFFFRRPDSDSLVSNCWYGRVYHPRSSFLAEGRRELKNERHTTTTTRWVFGVL